MPLSPRWPLSTFLLLVVALLSMSPGQAAAGEEVVFETDMLEIETSRGESHLFTVELATSHAQRARGLMYREELAPERGMLFIYPREEPVAMWMKNTFISLDMLFIDAHGRIVRIAERTEPLSRRSIEAGQPVLAVLELPGGTAERLAIAPGDRVRHSAFATAD